MDSLTWHSDSEVVYSQVEFTEGKMERKEVRKSLCIESTEDFYNHDETEKTDAESLTLRFRGSLKHLFREEDHPGYLYLKKLDVSDTELDNDDITFLGKALKQKKLPVIEELGLSRNVLTGKLQKLFGEDHPGIPTLKVLNLEDTKLDADDLKTLGEAIQQKKLPQIQSLDFKKNTFTGNLKNLFGLDDHPGFSQLQSLNLESAHPNTEDLRVISEAVKQMKLPKLAKIDLDYNELTGQLKHLFGATEHPGFASLQVLFLGNTKLGTEDLEAISKAARQGKIPRIEDVRPDGNSLTGKLKHLFGDKGHPGFPHLKTLDLHNAELGGADLQAISTASKQGKLPQLQDIQLDWDKTSGKMQHLFEGDDHPGLPSLQELNLRRMTLDDDDVKALSEAVKNKKLPQLKHLHLAPDNQNAKLPENLKNLPGQAAQPEVHEDDKAEKEAPQDKEHHTGKDPGNTTKTKSTEDGEIAREIFQNEAAPEVMELEDREGKSPESTSREDAKDETSSWGKPAEGRDKATSTSQDGEIESNAQLDKGTEGLQDEEPNTEDFADRKLEKIDTVGAGGFVANREGSETLDSQPHHSRGIYLYTVPDLSSRREMKTLQELASGKCAHFLEPIFVC